MKASIIITTRNRAADLKETLAAMARVKIPDAWQVELLVVDNGSTDSTREMVRQARLPDLELRYTREELTGQVRARNRGLAETTGEIILFTDDDVRPPENWILRMCEPVAADEAQAVAGGVSIAPHLLRPWMTKLHRCWLASSEWIVATPPRSMIGANMAFSRKVLQKVPCFDIELGPGALGFGDDAIFARQLRKAGFAIADRMDTVMDHHFDPARLLRNSWLATAAKHGRTAAYLTYHWEHKDFRLPRLRLWRSQLELSAMRKRSNPPPEGCDEKELRLIMWMETLRGYLVERCRPRHYDTRGLVKRNTENQSTSPRFPAIGASASSPLL